MCTVVCHWDPAAEVPVRMLAVRDEFAAREFDLPGAWWPDTPGVVGGRDRRAGGTWCVSSIADGATAVVLNRPERMSAEPGAASRGVLPLLALRHGEHWGAHVDVAPMAGFTLVRAAPDGLTAWTWIGGEPTVARLPAGTHVFTPHGRREFSTPFDAVPAGSVDERPLTENWQPWLGIVRSSEPVSDRAGLLVRRPIGADSFESVFAQFIAGRPGALRLDHLRGVARDPRGEWTTDRFA